MSTPYQVLELDVQSNSLRLEEPVPMRGH